MNTEQSTLRAHLPIWRRRRRAAAALLAAGGLIVASSSFFSGEPLPVGVPHDAYQSALTEFRSRFGRNPERLDAMMLLAEKAFIAERWQEALACFREIPTEHPQYGLAARLQQAQVLVRLDRARESEVMFRRYLDLTLARDSVPKEHKTTAYQWLVFMLSVELRFEDRKEVLQTGHAHGLGGVWESKLLHFPNLLIWNSGEGRVRLARFLENDPRNFALQLADARYLTNGTEVREAHSRLRHLYRADPADRRCQACLLEYYFQQNDWPNFSSIAKLLPEHESTEPWLLTRMRGEWALHNSRWNDAISSFQQVLQKDPANPWSTMGIARAYGGMHEMAKREEALRKSLILSRIRVGLYNVNEENPQACLNLAADCEQIGLREAAQCFREHAQRITRIRDAPQPTTPAPASFHY